MFDFYQDLCGSPFECQQMSDWEYPGPHSPCHPQQDHVTEIGCDEFFADKQWDQQSLFHQDSCSHEEFTILKTELSKLLKVQNNCRYQEKEVQFRIQKGDHHHALQVIHDCLSLLKSYSLVNFTCDQILDLNPIVYHLEKLEMNASLFQTNPLTEVLSELYNHGNYHSLGEEITYIEFLKNRDDRQFFRNNYSQIKELRNSHLYNKLQKNKLEKQLMPEDLSTLKRLFKNTPLQETALNNNLQNTNLNISYIYLTPQKAVHFILHTQSTFVPLDNEVIQKKNK